MKLKCLLFALIFLTTKFSFGQEKPTIINAKEVLEQGLKYYDEEKYEEAIKEYQKIPANDTSYYVAIVEQVLTYYQLEKYEEGIAIGKKGLGLNLDLSPTLFLNIGACYDKLKKPEEAIKLYDQGLKTFPKSYLITFNKGISYDQLEKPKEAFECFKKAIELNPFHPGSHYALGYLAMNEGNTSLAMLAFSTYILLSPDDQKANDALVALNDMSSTKYQEKTKSKGVDITDGDDMSEIDILIHNYVALDKKFKVKSKLKMPFIRQDYLLFDKLKTIESNGFWSKTYFPFYKQLMNDGKFDIFANYLLVPSANEIHKKIVAKNLSKLKDFYAWIKDNWDENHRDYEMPFNGKTQTVSIFRANRGFAISSIGTLNKSTNQYTGYAETFYPNGILKAKGVYNSEGKMNGVWTWYYDNGNVNSVETYDNGVLTSVDAYSNLGIIKTHIPYKNEKINGDAFVYLSGGSKDKLIALKDDLREGNYEEYYPNGTLASKTTNKKGIIDGLVKIYYNTGELKSEVTYVEGEKNSQEKLYYKNGNLMQRCSYIKGKLQGDFVSYYKNGRVSDSLKYLNDKAIGKCFKFFEDGTTNILSEFDESGKLNGFKKEFDLDGKIYNELEYKKGEIIGYKYYNKKGEIIKQDKKKSGNFDYEAFHQNGVKMSFGKYGKENTQGEWKYYNNNGHLESVCTYEDGKTEGDYTKYYPIGKVSKIIKYKEDLADGYYVEFFLNGNISTHGNYKADNQEGTWLSYNWDKSLASDRYYLEGNVHGTQKFYDSKGRLNETKTYYNGTLLYSTNCDTLGNTIDSINFTNASGKLVYHFAKSGQVECELNMVNDNYQGECKYYYPNGKIRITGQYLNDQKNGTWTWYNWNGTINSKGDYESGNQNGKWEYYNEDGKLTKTIEYRDGDENGKYIGYFDNGKVEVEKNYTNGILEGLYTYYTPEGTIEHKRQYLHNELISFTYFEASGAEKTIDVVNETVDAKIYFKNGKLAREFSCNKGLFSGAYNRYYSSGQLTEKINYVDDEISGDRILYHPNGKIQEKSTYINGIIHGSKEVYYSDGKIKEISNYYYGDQYGKCTKYDKSGKVIAVLTYYDDQVVDISLK